MIKIAATIHCDERDCDASAPITLELTVDEWIPDATRSGYLRVEVPSVPGNGDFAEFDLPDRWSWELPQGARCPTHRNPYR